MALGGIKTTPHANLYYGGNGVECNFHTCKGEISTSAFTVHGVITLDII